MTCRAMTGAFHRASQSYGSDASFRWSGPDGAQQVECRYEAKDAPGMLCHLLTTQAMTLDDARRQLAAWSGKVAV